MYSLHPVNKISPRACAPSPCFKPEGDRLWFSFPLTLLLFFLPFISVQSSIFPFLPTNKIPSYLMPIPWSILPSVSPLPFPILPFLLPYCDIWVVSSCCVCHTCVCMRHTRRQAIEELWRVNLCTGAPVWLNGGGAVFVWERLRDSQISTLL